MPSLPFGEFAPDHSDLTNPGMIDVRNALPGPSGYLPFFELVEFTNATSARPRGAIQASDQSSSVFQYAGDATKLYQNVNGTWTDKSKVGGYTTATAERWEFAIWKNKVLAVNWSDDPQSITFGGANFANLTTALKARHIAIIRDFVVMANTSDAVDGDRASRVRWSGFDDETSWTVSPSTMADFQDLKSSINQRVFGGEYGVVLQLDRVWRMTFVGSPIVFQFDEVLPGIGLIAPGAAAQDGDVIYFLSSKGFFALEQGTKASPIGAGRVDEFIRADLDLNYTSRMSTCVDPNSHVVFWAYPGTGNIAGRPNRILAFSPTFNRWSIIEEEVELLWAAANATNVTLDSAATTTDPDSLDDPIVADISLDDPRYVGGSPFLAAFDSDFMAASFSGAKRTATLVTKDFALGDGQHAQLNGFRALVQGGEVVARVGERNSMLVASSFGPILTPRAEQRFTMRANARYHRFELVVSGDWQHAIGVEIGRNDLKAGGWRG